METRLVPGLELKKYKMSLQYLVTPEDKEVLKEKKKRETCQKDTPQPEGLSTGQTGDNFNNIINNDDHGF